MQQPVMEDGANYASHPKSYDDLFPALPESGFPNQTSKATTQWGNSNNKMRVTSSTITQVYRVPFEERKLDGGSRFGEGESVQTCANIMKETGAHIEISHGKDQSLSFLVTGKRNEVQDARRKILSHFQTQAHKSIQIPKEHHKWILGKKGERLRELERTTATKISVPNMNDESDVITITGHKEGIEKAEHEIRVTSDLQSRKASEKLNIPKIYHPFIVGPYNENLNQLINETGSRIIVPPPSVMKDEIFISGDKEGVAAAKAKIEEIYKLMEKKCTTVSVEVRHKQHKYIIGPKGANIAEIMQKTGVSVEMPPSDSTSDTVTLRGPHGKLGLALDIVCDKANSISSCEVAVPSWLHKYIIGKKGQKIKELMQSFPKVHVEFTDKEDSIKIEGPPEEMEKAQERIEAIANELIRGMAFEEMIVDSKLFKHIIGKNGTNINKLKDDFNVAININENGLVRIEGSRNDVTNTRIELQNRIAKLENEKERDVIIDQRHFRNIIGTKGENIKVIREKFNQVQIIFPSPETGNNIVKVRGPKEDVDKCVKLLEKKVKELDESACLELPIHKQFHKFIIGKGGANIRKIREDTNTRIDLPAEGDKSDIIVVTGKKEDVEKASHKIRRIQEELYNIATEEITIDPKIYNSLIGSKGKLVHSITEKYGGVTIKFPSTESKSDKVIISGPKDDVKGAKEQLLELANERLLASYTAEIRAKVQHHKFLIGKNGVNIKKIRDSTGAKIIFPSSDEENREIITIIGRKESVEDAKQQLSEMIKEIDNIIEEEIRVESKHHRHFVARRGEVLHRITDECGGVMISFPRSGVESDTVVLKGLKEHIDAAKQKINEIIADLDSMITIECVIPQEFHRSVMGTRGRRVQQITSEFDVQIKFPERETENYQSSELQNGDVDQEQSPPPEQAPPSIRSSDVIRISGKEENCLLAKQALIDSVPITITVDVPFEMHRSIIGAKGQAVKDFMNRYDVHIVLSSADLREDIIKIKGTPAAVEEAKAALLDRVKELEEERKDRELKSFCLQLEINPDYHSKIIGKRGAVITKIRNDHDVQINLPKKGEENEHIVTILGYEENAYRARDDILKIVKELDELIKVEVDIDPRVHSRLIGGRGHNIRGIMDKFKVEIKFPRNTDPEPKYVVITGFENNVLDARDHLLTLADEYIQDVDELETRQKLHTLNFHFENPNSNSASSRNGDGGNGGGGVGNNGFVVAGGPWEQSAPNTASVTDFPAFGRPNIDEPLPAPSPIAGAWGNRR